jgi:ABC-type nitrate/sulfonate/bicarbonate transport system ATPase subunit
MKADAISCRGVTKRFGRLKVLADVDLSLPTGEVHGVIGPSGCGKTTLLRILAGLDNPTSGTIGTGTRSGRVAYVFQEARLIPWLTALENVLFVLRGLVRDPRERTERARRALRSVELDDVEGLYPDQLSGGMERRVALARALAYDPDIFLMDEPFAGLDFPLRMQLIDLFNRLLLFRPRSVVFVSHDTREIMHLCDRVHIMNGRPCGIQATIDLMPKTDRFDHPGYVQKMEAHLLNVMRDKAE